MADNLSGDYDGDLLCLHGLILVGSGAGRSRRLGLDDFDAMIRVPNHRATDGLEFPGATSGRLLRQFHRHTQRLRDRHSREEAGLEGTVKFESGLHGVFPFEELFGYDVAIVNACLLSVNYRLSASYTVV
jgi:hypothetical protein